MFLVIAPFLTRLDLWFYTKGFLHIRPWVVLVGTFAPVLLWSGVRVLTRPQRFSLKPDNLFLLFALLMVSLVELAGIAQYDSLPSDLHIVGFFWLDVFTVICGFCAGRALKQRSRHVFTFALILVAVSVLADWLTPGVISESSVGLRPAGFLENPNGAAFVVVTLLIGSMDWSARSRAWFYLPLLAAFITVIFTGSRGGLVALSGVFAIAWLNRALQARRPAELAERAMWGYGLIVLAVVLGLTIALSVKSRYVELATNGIVSDYAAQERLLAIDESVSLIADAPVVGHGTGFVYTMPLGPHNMALRVWIEHGLIGILAHAMLWMALVYIAVKRRNWQLGAIEIAALLMGAVSHNVLEDRTLLLSLGVMLSASALSRKSPAGVPREPALRLGSV